MNFRGIKPALMVGIVGALGVIAFVLLFGTVQKTVVGPGEGYEVYADLDDATGLVTYSKVTMCGVPIGNITSISLVSLEDGTSKARVRIRLKPDVVLYEGERQADGTYKNGAVLTRRTMTLLGDYYLEISPGFAGRRLENGDKIPNIVGEAGFMAIAGKLERMGELTPILQKIAEDLSAVTENLKAVYGGTEGKERILEITQNLQSAVRQIANIATGLAEFVERDVASQKGGVSKIVGSLERSSANLERITGENVESIRRVVQNLAIITDRMRELLTKSEDLQGEKVGETLARLRATVGHLEEASMHLASIARKIDAGEGTLGRMVNDDTLVRKTEEVVREAGELVKSVTRLETEIGFRSEFQIMERASKNYLTLRLAPSKNKYYMFELVMDPRGKSSTIERVTLTNDPSKPPVLTERVTETRMQLKFSLEFARRIGFFTGRFGLIESTGGIGMDFEFFKDSLKFSFDLFDFGSDRYPRLRTLASFAFLKYFYVSAGVDDVFNEQGRDYFFAGGIRFTDNDLKALLLVAPSASF